MKLYELIMILDPALAEEEVEGQIEEMREWVLKGGGTIHEVQRWGKKRLAYEVKKRREGYYVLLHLTADAKTASSLDRNLKISERVLKHMRVRFEEGQPSVAEKVEPKKSEELEETVEVKGEV